MSITVSYVFFLSFSFTRFSRPWIHSVLIRRKKHISGIPQNWRSTNFRNLLAKKKKKKKKKKRKRVEVTAKIGKVSISLDLIYCNNNISSAPNMPKYFIWQIVSSVSALWSGETGAADFWKKAYNFIQYSSEATLLLSNLALMVNTWWLTTMT